MKQSNIYESQLVVYSINKSPLEKEEVHTWSVPATESAGASLSPYPRRNQITTKR